MISPVKTNLSEKLKDKGYRHRFFRGREQDEIAQRIRELREFRNMKQLDLARESTMKQSAISRVEQASYSSWNLKTLWRLAEALDVRLRVIFEPMEEVIREYEAREKAQAEERQEMPLIARNPRLIQSGKTRSPWDAEGNKGIYSTENPFSSMNQQNLWTVPDIARPSQRSAGVWGP